MSHYTSYRVSALRSALAVASLAAILFPSHVCDAAPPRIANGKGEADFAIGPYTIHTFTYRPANYSAQHSPLVVVFHGHSRNPESYRDSARSIADECGGLVVAPFFDEKQFPGNAYNHGNVLKSGKLLPREQWTFSVVPTLIEQVRASEGRGNMPYYLIGHSGGGQFVERLMALVDLQPVRAVAANPGSHLFPTTELEFPYGFGQLTEEIANDRVLRNYLAAPLTIYLGTADTDPDHPQLDKNSDAAKQGPHRLARGHRCYEAAQALAAERRWKFGWQLVEAPGVDHTAGKMFRDPQCRKAMFGATAATSER